MTRKYTKAEAIGIVVRCAQTYKQELDGKNLLFICTDKHKKTIPIELSFYGNNYLHLTGLKAPKSENGDIAVELFANDFYQKCLDHKLSQTDFDFAEDGTTHMKLDVLPTVISKNLQAYTQKRLLEARTPVSDLFWIRICSNMYRIPL